MRRSIYYMVFFVFLFACEEATDWNLKTSNHDLIIVEGMMTNELKRQTIKLSKPILDLNEKPEPVSGAVVSVSSGNKVTNFYEYPPGSGLYYSDTVQAVVNRAYQLNIRYNEKEYSALAGMVPVTPLMPLNFSLRDDKSMLYEINYQDSDQPSIQEYWISWGHVSGYETLPLDETVAHAFHYTLSSIDVNQAFNPEKAKILFPAGSYVLRKKYSLSDDHQAFLRTFLSETEWRGSIFDVQKGNVITNLSEGAVGFFAVSTVVSDTTIIVP